MAGPPQPLPWTNSGIKKLGSRTPKLSVYNLGQTYNFTYDDANQLVQRQLGTTTVETFTHDKDGNMIARAIVAGDTTNYVWGDKNQLQERKVNGTSAEKMKYDLGNIRESKNNGTKYFSSGSVSLADMRPSSVPVSYFQGHQLLGMEVNGTFYYYLTDGLSNVRLVVDSIGAVVASSKYDEFGIPETDLDYTAGNADLRPHGYVGGLGVRNDWASSGLHYMRQRYYDPQLGRFLNQDPIGFVGGLNMYSYCSGDPINNADPTGLYVDLTYEVRTGTLTVQDYRRGSGGSWEKNGAPTTFQAASGGMLNKPGPSFNNPDFEADVNVGPIPRGEYYLSQMKDVSRPDLNGDREWFQALNMQTLRGQVDVKDPSTGKTVTRDELMIHPGLVSDGCVTFRSESAKGDATGYPRSSEYSRFKAIVSQTEPIFVSGKQPLFKFLVRHATVSGYLHVK